MNSRFENGMDPMNRSKGKASTNASQQKKLNNLSKGGPASKLKKEKSILNRPMQAPVSTALSVTNTGPSFRNMRNRVQITHRELFSSLTGSTTFGLAPSTGITINPGNATTFPWLSTQAQGWEKYRFKMLRVRYVPRCPSSNPGAVTFSADYDVTDLPPVSEQQLAAYHGSVENSCWREIIFDFDKSQLNIDRFVLTGQNPSGNDLRLSNVAQLYVGCADGSSTSPNTLAWGKVWLEYDVELINQQVNPPIATNLVIQANNTSGLTAGASGLGTTSFNTYNPTGTVTGTAWAGNVPYFSYSSSGNTVTVTGLPKGTEFTATYSYLEAGGPISGIVSHISVSPSTTTNTVTYLNYAGSSSGLSTYCESLTGQVLVNGGAITVTLPTCTAAGSPATGQFTFATITSPSALLF